MYGTSVGPASNEGLVNGLQVAGTSASDLEGGLDAIDKAPNFAAIAETTGSGLFD